jgi:hypothetical protein
MSRTKVVMLGLLAAFALSAVSSSAASAHEWLVNGKPIGTGEEVELNGSLIPNQPTQHSQATVAGLPIDIVCHRPHGFFGWLKAAVKFIFKGVLSVCQAPTIASGVISNQPKCKVSDINVEGKGELIEAGQVVLSGAPFATFKIEEVMGAGACALTGEYKIEGTQVCTLPHYSVTATTMVLECNGAGSKELKLGVESTKFYAQALFAGAKGQTLSSN